MLFIYYSDTNNDDTIDLPKPRRNSIDFSKESEETEKKYENQISDFSHRRHTDNTMERRNLNSAKMEFTTQKIRQEWAEHEDQLFGGDVSTAAGSEEFANGPNTTATTSINADLVTDTAEESKIKPNDSTEVNTKESTDTTAGQSTPVTAKDETKSKKKRRKKSLMKKKATQRKSSSSSSVGSTPSDQNDGETDTVSLSNNTATGGSSNEDSPKSEHVNLEKAIELAKANEVATESVVNSQRVRDLDIHFFSDTELASGKSPQGSRPTTPIQSDSEFEIKLRAQNDEKNDLMTRSASWKWGELPTQGEDTQEATTEGAKQAQRNSMISNMFSFMKQSKKMRKGSSEGVYLSDLDPEGMDPEMAAMYFPPINKEDPAMSVLPNAEDDRESGNGTSLPHSPSSVEGHKSLDSDYDDGKLNENKYVE